MIQSFKDNNIKIFNDTQTTIENSESLSRLVNNSVNSQKYISSKQPLSVNRNRFTEEAQIKVTHFRTFEAAEKYRDSGKVCVLNFSSATHPGGGVTWGTSAQEESLCRISTLYNALNDSSLFSKYYGKNRKLIGSREMGGEYCSDCIYTPNVMVIKEDDFVCKTLPENKWYNVDVITCAAPDLRDKTDRKEFRPTKEELFEIHEERARRILDIAVSEKVDIIVLGAFGCGVFANPPEIVAGVYARVLKDYRFAFKTVEFAIFDANQKSGNYKTFSNLLSSDAERNDSVQIICFHNPDEENGYFSNWFISEFELKGIKYSSMEQYMMHQKALVFNDTETASLILKESDVAKIKAFGRMVKNYNDVVWNGVRQIIIYKGLMQKFSQNEELKDALLATGTAVLAECAVNDRVWGIGVSMKDERRYCMEKWEGLNLLGFAIMAVRDEV